mmetsp:Transcript_13738/g.25783  ORF Transcript_13738/g.25783 Transcript_13738/m.25783 type:complete len:98 (-) Transcript_13738:352-645(-)
MLFYSEPDNSRNIDIRGQLRNNSTHSHILTAGIMIHAANLESASHHLTEGGIRNGYQLIYCPSERPSSDLALVDNAPALYPLFSLPSFCGNSHIHQI